MNKEQAKLDKKLHIISNLVRDAVKRLGTTNYAPLAQEIMAELGALKSEENALIGEEYGKALGRSKGAVMVCTAPKHDKPSPLPCSACQEECDPKYFKGE